MEQPAVLTAFDRLAAAYDRWYDEHPHAYQAELSAVRRFIPQGGKGVEIGVGTGRFAAALGIKTGVEPSESMAALARSRGIEVCRAHGEDLPFADAAFDFVLIVTALCFARDPARFISEANRVLKPHGRLVLAFLNRETALGSEYEAKKAASEFYREARFYSAEEVSRLLAGAGFADLQFCQTIFAAPHTMTAPDPVKEGYGEGLFTVVAARKATGSNP